MIERVKYFDIARAICVLWIVGFWHVMGYWTSPYDDIVGSNLGQSITWGILAAFTFFSGYFLRRKQVRSVDELFSFLKARFFKFYILYAISCITLFMAGIILTRLGKGQVWFNSLSSLLLSLLGLGTYFGEAPATLWYMTMLMSFYFLTPVFLYLKRINKFVYILVLHIILYILVFQKYIDIRNLMYFPFYVLGLYSNDLNKFFEKNVITKLLFSLIIFAILFNFQKFDMNPISVIFYLNSLMVVILILLISKIIESTFPKTISFFLLIGFSSMTSFLFHRQIYGLLKILIRDIGITPVTTTFIFVPITFYVSFLLQKAYDRNINKLAQ